MDKQRYIHARVHYPEMKRNELQTSANLMPNIPSGGRPISKGVSGPHFTWFECSPLGSDPTAFTELPLDPIRLEFLQWVVRCHWGKGLRTGLNFLAKPRTDFWALLVLF